MPSKSPAQARMMAAAAHDPAFARKVGVPQTVAREFNRADAESGYLSSAMKALGGMHARKLLEARRRRREERGR